MWSDASTDDGLGQAVRAVSRHAVALTKLEAKLARLELAGKARRFLPAAGFALVAVVLGLFAVGYGLAAGADGLDAVLPRWAALLAVAGALAAVAALLGTLAAVLIKRASPPVPEQAIAEVRETKRTLRAPSR